MSDSDILKRAKAAAEKFKSSDESVNHVFWGYRAAEELLPELIAEVEAKNKQIKELQDLIDKPPEEADWVADYHLLQSALDGPIIDAARKWHAAYRKAQNSNLMRAKEVERLRSAVETWEQANSDLIAGLKAGATEVIAKDARIADQEAYIERLEVAFLRSNAAMRYYQEGNRGPWPQVGEQFKEPYIQKAREALEQIKEDGKDEEL